MKAFKKYFIKRKRAIGTLLEKSGSTYTPDTYHKLRIEIKKLNAFFDLIKFCSKEFKRKKILKPFRHIYRQAGKVRELQVEEEMLEKYFASDFLKEYRNNVRKVRLKKQKKYFSLANENFAKGLMKSYRDVYHHIAQIDDEKVKCYLDDRRLKIVGLLDQNTNPAHAGSQIHTFRKRLKKFNYILRIIDLVNNDERMIKMNVLLDLLGKWRDCQVLLKNIKSAKKNVGVNTEEMNQLEELEAKLFSESRLLFNEISLALPSSEFYKSKTATN